LEIGDDVGRKDSSQQRGNQRSNHVTPILVVHSWPFYQRTHMAITFAPLGWWFTLKMDSSEWPAGGEVELWNGTPTCRRYASLVLRSVRGNRAVGLASDATWALDGN
jgi:hypothetical protein